MRVFKKCTEVELLLMLVFVLQIISQLEANNITECDRLEYRSYVAALCSNNTNSKCNLSRIGYLYCQHFVQLSCAFCYEYTFHSRKYKIKRRNFELFHEDLNRSFVPDINCQNSAIYESLETTFEKNKWKDCCNDAWKCCESMMTSERNTSQDSFCPKTWDGWVCWDKTAPNTQASKKCPVYPYLTESFINEYSYKTCLQHGNWSAKDNLEWTDYTKCTSITDLTRRMLFNIGCHLISIIAIIPSIFIFVYFKKLRVHHLRIHKNFLLSLLCHGVMRVAFGVWYIQNIELILKESDSRTEIICKTVHSITEYYRLCSYTWMFCEGLYLHMIIAAAFRELKHLRLLYLIGWLSPSIFVVIYVVMRSQKSKEDQTVLFSRCWIQADDNMELILRIPAIIGLVMNLLFLINILRILISKISASAMQYEPAYFRRAMKSTLMLLPLFGLQMTFTMFRPKQTDSFTSTYLIIDYVIEGIQGFIVAFLFCYFNHEVLAVLKAKYHRYLLRKHPELEGQTTNNSRRSLCSFISLSSIQNSPAKERKTSSTVTNTSNGQILHLEPINSNIENTHL